MEDNKKTIDATVNEETNKVEEVKEGFFKRNWNKAPKKVKTAIKWGGALLLVAVGGVIVKKITGDIDYEDIVEDAKDTVEEVATDVVEGTF